MLIISNNSSAFYSLRVYEDKVLKTIEFQNLF